MIKLRQRVFILLGSSVLILGSFCLAHGQYTRSRRVRVYNPGRYHRTRSEMSRRAAMRKVFKTRRAGGEKTPSALA